MIAHDAHAGPTIRRLLLALAVVAAATLAGPRPAGAIDTSPRYVYEATYATSAVQVSGSYTPVVGNFAGSLATDILWYAPGPAPDHLWTSTGRGTFARSSLRIDGTYQPLVGDFGGDAFDDIIWYAPGRGNDALWTSVVGANPFRSSPLTVDGTYRPVVLDQSLDLAVWTTGYVGSLPKDIVVWYQPGPGVDRTWAFAADGTHSTGSVDIVGSPQLVPFNVDSDPFEDLLAYTPGSGPDAIFRSDTGALVKTPKTVNGTYAPQVVGGGYRDSILWLGPGPGTDALWANLDCCGLTNQATQPVDGTRVVPVGVRSDVGYSYNPSGPDRGFIDGYVVTSLGPDIGAGAIPLVGDFDGDHAVDAFFYRPGTASDRVAYSATPAIP